MYCSNCGALNDDSAYQCIRCNAFLRHANAGAPMPGVPPLPMYRSIPNYLVHAILVTLFCCLPFGIVAIVFAAQVNSRLQAGDIQGALDCSNKAKMWSWIAFGLGFAVVLIYVFLVLLGLSTGMTSEF